VGSTFGPSVSKHHAPKPRGSLWHLVRATSLGAVAGAVDAAMYVTALYVVVMMSTGGEHEADLAQLAMLAGALGALPGLLGGFVLGTLTSPFRSRKPGFFLRLLGGMVGAAVGALIPWMSALAIEGLGDWTDLAVWTLPIVLAALSGWSAPTVLLDRYPDRDDEKQPEGL
jgi:hypothetical protein